MLRSGKTSGHIWSKRITRGEGPSWGPKSHKKSGLGAPAETRAVLLKKQPLGRRSSWLLPSGISELLWRLLCSSHWSTFQLGMSTMTILLHPFRACCWVYECVCVVGRWSDNLSFWFISLWIQEAYQMWIDTTTLENYLIGKHKYDMNY